MVPLPTDPDASLHIVKGRPGLLLQCTPHAKNPPLLKSTYKTQQSSLLEAGEGCSLLMVRCIKDLILLSSMTYTADIKCFHSIHCVQVIKKEVSLYCT